MTDGKNQGSAITAFTVINFAFAGIALMGLAMILLALVYGVFFSGDEGEELMAGVFGSVFIGFFLLAGIVVYLGAGIGLAKRRRWGYYLHIAGAVMAVMYCCGVVYTVVALIFALKPEFKDEFS